MKKRTAKQLAADKSRSEKMKAKLNKQGSQASITPELPSYPQEVRVDEQGPSPIETLQKQINEVMETNALLKAVLLGRDQNGVNLGRSNQVVGEVDKYLVDPNNYPDPTARLAAEDRLRPLAFDYNYELDYGFSVRSYETKTGINMREPEFLITLSRIRLDDQGNQTDKRYIARRLIFHEDPQAALVVARDNNIDIDEGDQKTFLNEMRYLRIRDWLFDIFWPVPATPKEAIHEEVIGGTIVQVYTKSSHDSEGINFDQIKKTKLV